MDNSLYEKIIREDDKVDWYGTEVPQGLITSLVRFASEGLSHELDKLKSSLDELRGSDLEKRKNYIKAVERNLQTLPYTLNGDFYMKKRKRIESSIEEENKNKKPVKKSKETTKNNKVTSKKTTKNGDLIFGKK
jgi:hypothetical protein